jgi:hypothetical protein
MKSPEETMLWHSGDGRECIASITGWREPVDYYFKNFLPVWKSAVTGRHFDRLNLRSRFDAILPLNHAIGLGVDESLANAWRIGALLDFPQVRRRAEAARTSPMPKLKERPEKRVRAFEWTPHGGAQQYHLLNQVRKSAG